MARKPELPSFGLVLVRLATGAMLLTAGWQRIRLGTGSWLVESTAERIATAPAAFAWWGREVLLDAPALFALLFIWGTFTTGVLLFLGALVRPAAAAAVLLLAHVYLAGPLHYRELAALLAVCAVACAVSKAGRRVGCDEWLDGQLPRWLTWA